MEFAQNEMLRQIFDDHWAEFCDYMASKTKDASQIETVNFDSSRHRGVLMKFDWQGVRKIVCVSPEELVSGLSQLNEELRRRCINAADEAERATSYANGQGDYAKDQGDRVDSLIEQITELKARVTEQGNTAESQGNLAHLQMEAVRSWFTPFSASAENWFYGISADVANWFNSVKTEWTSWFSARQDQWASWFTNGIVSDWNSFWATARAAFAQWTDDENERKANELVRQQDESIRSGNESERQAAERLRNSAEQERISHEEVRLDGTFRQNSDTGNWERLNQRTGEWEDTGNSWQGGLLAYRFYTDWHTGRIHVVKNTMDKVSFSIRKGRLIATYND